MKPVDLLGIEYTKTVPTPRAPQAEHAMTGRWLTNRWIRILVLILLAIAVVPARAQQTSTQKSGSNACEPFGPGGYNYCDNPAGTQPAGCDCSKQGSTAIASKPPRNATTDVCKSPQTEGNNAALNKAWYQWCIDWQELLQETVADPLIAQFGSVPSPTNGYQYVQVTYQATLHITSGRKVSITGRYYYWSSDNNKTGLALANEVAKLYQQLNGHAPPFPTGSKISWLNRPQSYKLNTEPAKQALNF